MRLIPFTILLFFYSLLSSQNPAISYKKDQIDSLLNEAHARGFFNGNALVAVKGKIIYQSQIGFANARKTQNLRNDHIFKIGSVSKEFDGVALMLLNQEGKLGLDAKLSEFFPSLPSWSHLVSVQHLLKYTSGLPSNNDQTVRTDEQVWEFLNSLDKLSFEPGTRYNYNNLNTFLRKRIVEKVSGMPFSEFVEIKLLEPADVHYAIIDPKPKDDKFVKAFDTEFKEDNFSPYMSGWVALNIQDMYNWIQSLHSGKILNRQSLTKLSESFKNGQSTLGTLVFKEGSLYYQYHHGQSGSYEASIYYNPADEFTVIFLSNQKGNNLGDLTSATDAILRGENFQIPKKSIELSLRSKIQHYGFEAGMEFFNHIKDSEFDIYDFPNEEKELLDATEYLKEIGHNEQAEKLLNFISTLFPESR